MERNLLQIPSGIGEPLGIKIKEVIKSDEDIKILNRLHNEAFREHFNFRPETIRETSFWIKQSPWFNVSEYFFACLKDKPVGFVGAGIDEEYNRYQKKKAGWILTIGVIQPHRRRGIGTALMLHAMKYLKKHGMKEAALGVDDSNPTKAIELYKKVGFTVKRKDLVYIKNLV